MTQYYVQWSFDIDGLDITFRTADMGFPQARDVYESVRKIAESDDTLAIFGALSGAWCYPTEEDVFTYEGSALLDVNENTD